MTHLNSVEVTDRMASKAGRVLADRYADQCGVDREDNWKIYGSDFIEDARAMLIAALNEVEQQKPT